MWIEKTKERKKYLINLKEKKTCDKNKFTN